MLSDSRCCFVTSGLLLLTAIFVPTLVGVLVQDSIKPPTVFLQTGDNQSTIVEVRIKHVFIFTLKLPILLSKKTTKRDGGGQKLPILRRHTL